MVKLDGPVTRLVVDSDYTNLTRKPRNSTEGGRVVSPTSMTWWSQTLKKAIPFSRPRQTPCSRNVRPMYETGKGARPSIGNSYERQSRKSGGWRDFKDQRPHRVKGRKSVSREGLSCAHKFKGLLPKWITRGVSCIALCFTQQVQRIAHGQKCESGFDNAGQFLTIP